MIGLRGTHPVGHELACALYAFDRLGGWLAGHEIPFRAVAQAPSAVPGGAGPDGSHPANAQARSGSRTPERRTLRLAHQLSRLRGCRRRRTAPSPHVTSRARERVRFGPGGMFGAAGYLKLCPFDVTSWHRGASRHHPSGRNHGHLSRRRHGAPPQHRPDPPLRRRTALPACARPAQLTARCLDELAAIVAARRDHRGDRPFHLRVRHGSRRAARDAQLSRLHANRPAPRSTTSSATASPTTSRCSEGDIVNIDVTYILDGWHGDSSRMYPVGQIKRAAERLLEVTHECLMRGVAAVQPGARTGAIGARDPDLCRGRALLGGARFLRPRRRPAVPRRAEHPALRQRQRRRRRCARA